MAGESASPPTKTSWFIIFGAMTACVLTYGMVCFFVAQSRTAAPPTASVLHTLRPVFYMVAGAELLVSIVWVHFRTSGKIGDAPAVGNAGASGELMSPAQFQTDTIVGMALGEICATLGLTLFFLGAPITEFARFAAGTLAVYLFYILPRGIKYWTAWEARQKANERADSGPFSQSF